ncbi:carbon-monoxide dehydrogenase large subunit [Lipingzhangella halophila]|uniref:Carbon-monoxide dehydrogenase large subunit n=1 Tax=Lipingzhangella halophila TaxID=1783352 RepID=A0A7W7RG41_9ACTN|nr:xanthine dehydrogenase family protein molybdopterin-binding subunit [Lipingzhangella halophila]MBB4931250.1 carbon-monoxide dehydrogenase large subunit [Lipingzhangella halophila]
MPTDDTLLNGSVLGHPVRRVEDQRLVTGQASYVDNLNLPGAAYVAFVRSPVAHARIRSVDTGPARRAPGVYTVVTADDITHHPVPLDGPQIPEAMRRRLLAHDAVRYVGEPVAAVVAETPAAATDALERVEVDYDPLPAVVDPREAATDSTVLFTDVGTNTVWSHDDEDPTAFTDAFFADCEVVVRQHLAPQRLAPCPLEVRAAAAVWEDGRLRQWASTQVPHRLRDEISTVLGIAPERVQVVSPDVGGGFGAKAANYGEYFILGALAQRVGRPVKWVETRSESMSGLGHGRGQAAHIEIGGDRDGRVHAYRWSVLADSGAYPMLGAVLPAVTRLMGPGPYAIDRYACRSRSVVTNTVPTVAYRGAGRPEATHAIERAMDLFAAEVDLDPVEVRRRNLVAPDSFPYSNAAGLVYDSGAYESALDTALDAAGYSSLRQEQQERRERGDVVQLGIGISTYVEITNVRRQPDMGAVEIDPEGHPVVRAGTHSQGQGHATSYAMIAAEVLGVGVGDVRFVQGDTDAVPSGVGTFGSRSMQTSGTAVLQASEEVAQLARQRAAELLEASADDIEFDQGNASFGVRGVPGIGVGWRELGAHAAETGQPLAASVDFAPENATFPSGAHIAAVQVDTQTGDTRLRRIVAVDDCGRVLNPLLVEGQLHGGLAQGIAQALYEEVRYDDEGNPLTSTFADYGIPAAPDLPDFDLVSQQTPSPVNGLGVKGVGESGTIGAIPAVANAVADALAPYGVRHVDLPATPERVWRLLRSGGGGAVPTVPAAAPHSEEPPDATAAWRRGAVPLDSGWARVRRLLRDTDPVVVGGCAVAAVGAAVAVRALRRRGRR